MQKKHIHTEIEVYTDETELSSERLALLTKAKEAASGAYAPYSKFRVGAAVLLENGLIVLGSNQENAAYPSTMCAERNAIAAAASAYPNQKIIQIAITIVSPEGRIKTPVPPCGACRQVIFESEYRYNNSIELILQGDSGIVYVVGSIKDILPLTFDATFLKID
jgi:cytidine deaminase